MTNLEALRHSVAIPVSDNALKLILILRSMNSVADFTGESREFDLAKADLYVYCITQPNVGEGGYSLSMTEKKELGKLAARLYEKHGIDNPLSPTIKDASNRW